MQYLQYVEKMGSFPQRRDAITLTTVDRKIAKNAISFIKNEDIALTTER